MEIKGIKEGILITFGEQNWQDAKLDVLQKIETNQDFFRGARIIVDAGNTVIDTDGIVDLQEKLNSKQVQLHGILSKSLITQGVAKSLGLITKLDKPKKNIDAQLKPVDTVLEGESSIFINRTLRSGYKVGYQGHVVVVGDVNPGAEIIASGSIIIWGRLRGTVHAGSEGDQSAYVCALDLSPTQLRIASQIVTTPHDQKSHKPEMAIIQRGQIIAVPWDHKKGDK